MRRLKRKRPWFVVPLLACCPLLFACGTPDEAREEKATGKVRISPSGLFRGSLKRIEPHLGLTSACVQVEFETPTLPLRVSLDVWEKGKRVRERSASHIVLKSPGEVSLSLKEVPCRDGKWRWQYCQAEHSEWGDGSVRGTVDLPELKTFLTTAKPLRAPIQVKVNETVAVCGIMAGKGADKVLREESVEEMAKRVDWALVLKLKPLKKEE